MGGLLRGALLCALLLSMSAWTTTTEAAFVVIGWNITCNLPSYDPALVTLDDFNLTGSATLAPNPPLSDLYSPFAAKMVLSGEQGVSQLALTYLVQPNWNLAYRVALHWVIDFDVGQVLELTADTTGPPPVTCGCPDNPPFDNATVVWCFCTGNE